MNRFFAIVAFPISMSQRIAGRIGAAVIVQEQAVLRVGYYCICNLTGYGEIFTDFNFQWKFSEPLVAVRAF